MDPDRVRVTSVVNEGMDHGFTGTFPYSDLHSLAFSSFLLWDNDGITYDSAKAVDLGSKLDLH